MLYIGNCVKAMVVNYVPEHFDVHSWTPAGFLVLLQRKATIPRSTAHSWPVKPLWPCWKPSTALPFLCAWKSWRAKQACLKNNLHGHWTMCFNAFSADRVCAQNPLSVALGTKKPLGPAINLARTCLHYLVSSATHSMSVALPPPIARLNIIFCGRLN